MFDGSVVKHGLAVLGKLLRRLMRKLCRGPRRVLDLLRGVSGKGERTETTRNRDCIRPPEVITARPDPYIYSQFWLEQRHIAYVWDNPDFRLIDPDNGLAVDHHKLKPAKRYRVEATVHNGSTMAALGVAVRFEVLEFGAGTAVLAHIGDDTIDVAAAGSSVAQVDWVTPPTAGHNCLRATISHPWDANPLNNVGQHNTDVAAPASPERALAFDIDLPDDRRGDDVEIAIDAYRLPEDPQCADSYEERATLAYLERLQREHDPARFPVPDGLAPRLAITGETIPFEEAPRPHEDDSRPVTHVREPPMQARAKATVRHPGGKLPVALVVEPPPPGRGRQAVNVHVFHADRLLGGVTAYIEQT